MAETLVELIARIKADSSQLEQGLTGAERKTADSSKKMQESIKKVGMAMAATGAAITAGFALMVKSAMEVASTRTAFEHLTKSHQQSSKEILDALKAASAGTISEYDLMLAANRAMVLGVAQNSDQFTSLMEIARDRARTMGLSVTQAFNDIVTGIGRGSPLILDNLGIVVDAAEANEKYAQTIGKVASNLSEAEKQQALLNVVLEQGQKSIDRTSQVTMTASEQFQSAKTSVKNLTDQIGSYLLPVIQSILETITPVIVSIISWTKENPKLAKTIAIVSAALGVVLTVVGGLILILPSLISGVAAFGVVFHAALGPIGLISLAITALIAIGILLWKNWDKVWNKIKEITEIVVESIVHAAGWMLDKILAYYQLYATGIGWLMKRIADVVGLFAPQWAESIRNAADTMTKAVDDFRTKAVTALSDFDINFTKTVKGTKDGAAEIVEATEGIGKATEDMVEVQASALELGKAQFKAYLDSMIALKNQVLDSLRTVFGTGSGIASGLMSGQRYAYRSEQEWMEALAGMGNIYTGEGWITPEHSPEQYQKAMEEYGSPEASILGYATGGVVPGVIGQPQLAMVHGGETIIPANESMGGVTVNFTQPVFFDREDTMNKFVDMIRKGIQRQDRLRFGGAYNG